MKTDKFKLFARNCSLFFAKIGNIALTAWQSFWKRWVTIFLTNIKLHDCWNDIWTHNPWAYLATPDKLALALFILDHLESVVLWLLKNNTFTYSHPSPSMESLFQVVEEWKLMKKGTVCVLKPRPQQRKSQPSLVMMNIIIFAMMVTWWWYIYNGEVSVCLSRKMITSFKGLWKKNFLEYFFDFFFEIFFFNLFF